MLENLINFLTKIGITPSDLLQYSAAIAGLAAAVFAILVNFRDTANSKVFITDYDRAKYVTRLNIMMKRVRFCLVLSLLSVLVVVLYLVIPGNMLSPLLLVLAFIAFFMSLCSLIVATGWPSHSG